MTLARERSRLCACVLCERRTALLALAKKFSILNRGTRQNQLVRTNRTRRAFPVSTPAGNSFPTLRPPCLCALCVKGSFPASLFIATFAPEKRRLVAQCAAPLAGPEAFSCLCSSGVGAGAFLGARPEVFVCESAYVSAVATLAESALTQKHRGWVHAKDLYVEPRTSARHSALLMGVSAGRLHSPAEHRSLRRFRGKRKRKSRSLGPHFF